MKNANLKIILISFLLFGGQAVVGQHYFVTSTDVQQQAEVLDQSKEVIPYPWAGGMNSCQFGEVDMNLDGIKDLFVFDRMGDRVMTFINNGTPGQVDITFAPEYIDHFPELFDWAILRDYNMDGKEDIFTYAKEYPGILVYKNVSQATLAFDLEVYPFLTSLQGGGQVNILTTDVDYPGIEDVDNDGDMDILTFWGLGSFVEYHQNQSMELYGIPDSLEYVEVTQCWGHFAESDESNHISLDTCMNKQGSGDLQVPKERHTGSTFLLLDMDGDLDKDLVLGDVDYPNLILLMNGGNEDTAHMISQDPAFPSDDKPVNLFAMPAGALVDVNNDGARDLLVSPFDPSLMISANFRSSCLYENMGSNAQPDFHFVQQDFIQEGMIDVGSGAYPVLEDYNGDGLTDLFIGNFGYYMYSTYDQAMQLSSVYWSNIALYENNGTPGNPQFVHVTHDYAGLHELHRTGLFPSFGDLDGDGDRDMVLGNRDGSILYLENTAGNGQVPVYAPAVFNFQMIDVGEYSAPQLWDLDQDGLLDLVVGEMNGNLNYFRNTGTGQQAQFVLETDSLGQVNVTDYNLSYTGFSTPCFFYNPEGTMELLVGSEQGKVFYFRDIEGNTGGAFEASDSLFMLIDDASFDFRGIRSGAAIADLAGDEHPELIVGNYSGGLQFFKGILQPPVSGTGDMAVEKRVLLYPNPAGNEIMISGIKNENGLTVEIYDVYGKLVKQGRLEASCQTIDISGLPPGLFLVRGSQPGLPTAAFSGKFIKSGSLKPF